MEAWKRTRTRVALIAVLLCLVLTAVAILGTQRGGSGVSGYVQGGIAMAIAGAVIFAFATRARQSRARMLSGIAVVLLLTPVVGILMNGTPPVGTLINDITTDTIDPPAFNALIRLRPEGSNPVEYGGEVVAARQAELYADIQPVQSTLGVADAFQRALETAESMGWDIVASDDRAGIVEAIDTTRIFRFKDDIVIRVRGTAQGSRIDIRSRSRLGRSDLGKNAARIREYIQRFSS